MYRVYRVCLCIERPRVEPPTSVFFIDEKSSTSADAVSMFSSFQHTFSPEISFVLCGDDYFHFRITCNVVIGTH